MYLAIDQVDVKYRPEITLTVNGKPMIFLVDSGAERTVLRDTTDLPVGPKTIRVMSANGVVKVNNMSGQINFCLDEEDSGVTCSVVLAPECPHNLLGRDLILSLELAIVPTTEGTLKVIKHALNSLITDTMVVEAKDAPHYWWSLDLTTKDPAQISKLLIKEAVKKVSRDSDKMSSENLHVTLRYKKSSGPDEIYDTAVQNLGPQHLSITYLYYMGSTSFCDVEISPQASQLMPDRSRRHISLTKRKSQKWYELGRYASDVRYIDDWEDFGSKGEQKSKRTGWCRKRLNFRTSAQPAVHLTDDPMTSI